MGLHGGFGEDDTSHLGGACYCREAGGLRFNPHIRGLLMNGNISSSDEPSFCPAAIHSPPNTGRGRAKWRQCRIIWSFSRWIPVNRFFSPPQRDDIYVTGVVELWLLIEGDGKLPPIRCWWEYCDLLFLREGSTKNQVQVMDISPAITGGGPVWNGWLGSNGIGYRAGARGLC